MARKKGKRSKYKRRKFISKISSDGKISKKEGRKASKKGISLRKIKNRNVSDYRSRKRDFERRGRKDRSPLRSGPSFEPLKIKRGAERADFARQMKDYQGSSRRSGSKRRDKRDDKDDNKTPEFTPTPLPTDYDEEPTPTPETPTPTPTPPSGPSAEDLLADQIASMQAGFMESMQEQAAMFQQMQTSQNERMAALQQQMLQSQVNQSERPQVAGVKMADGSAGNNMQISRRGVSGAFSRRGMRISSLNL